ncbi:MAG: tetratricopeptide repeat protein [Leptolyngbyaceae cyanobacterium MO_188.B28]|nr:tetratricopeptide repeat protein [Leptolyngbyaceae cyanobacterium MO_188.B28]
MGEGILGHGSWVNCYFPPAPLSLPQISVGKYPPYGSSTPPILPIPPSPLSPSTHPPNHPMLHNLHPLSRRPKPILLAIALLAGLAIAPSLPVLLNSSPSPYRYPFTQTNRTDITGQLEQELAFYKARIRRNPEDGLNQAAVAGVYLRLVQATGDANWYLMAEQAANTSLNNLPFNNSGALLALANIAEAKHDFVQAIALAHQVLDIQPRHEEALAVLVTSHLGKGKIAAADTAARQLVEQAPTLGSHTLMALVHVAQGQDEAAIQRFQSALAVEEPETLGSSAWTRTLMARFYASRGQIKQAKALYREALRILPRSPFVLTQLAQLETRLGQYRAAEKHYAQVFFSQDYPNVWDHVALQGMAQVKDLQGDRPGAEALWRQAETLFRQHQDLSTFGHRRELARLLLSRGLDRDLPEALTLMEADLQIRRDAETLDIYAWVLTRLNRWQDAQAILQDAIATGRRSAVIFTRAAQVETHLGNTAQAQTYRQSAQAADPTFGPRDRQIWGLGD